MDDSSIRTGADRVADTADGTSVEEPAGHSYAQTDDESTLVARLKAGDREAFRDAVVRYSPRMLAAARAIAGSANAEDVVQETWIAVLDKIGQFQGRSALGTWLLRIVSNRAVSHLRAHAREVSAPESDDEPQAAWFDEAGRWSAPPTSWHAGSPEELLSADALQHCIDRHLELMPAQQRLVVVMRDIQQQS